MFEICKIRKYFSRLWRLCICQKAIVDFLASFPAVLNDLNVKLLSAISEDHIGIGWDLDYMGI